LSKEFLGYFVVQPLIILQELITMSDLKTAILNQPLHSFFPKSPLNIHSRPLPKTASSYALAGSVSDLSRFSHTPSQVSTFTDTKVIADAIFPSKAHAIADANAIFIGGSEVPKGDTGTATDVLSIAEGAGLKYRAQAIARTEIKGLDFYIKPKETFKFDFQGSMSLVAQGNNRRQQSIAQGRTTYLVYGTNDRGHRTLLDQLIIEGRQYSTFNGLSIDAAISSKGFKLNLNSQPLSMSSNALSFNGTYSRTFNSAMRITLVETQQTNAKVSFATRGKA
jgi:hypothetical protein